MAKSKTQGDKPFILGRKAFAKIAEVEKRGDTCPRCGGPTHEHEILCARCDAIVEGRDAELARHIKIASPAVKPDKKTSAKIRRAALRVGGAKPRSKIENLIAGTWAKPGELKTRKAKAKP